jgi:metallo-beta-lactamase family protein
MKLRFLGAAGMVTGSCHLVETEGFRLLVDCGLFQGADEELNREPFSFSPATLDAVILTHAHIDHAGRLPLLRKEGYQGPIYAHPATVELAQILLEDSASIQEADAERESRKASRAGRRSVEPLYTVADARALNGQFRPVPYGRMIRLTEGLQFRLQDAGHILGSAFVELLRRDDAGQETRLVFSGDLGQPDRPILRDPAVLEQADYLVLESTYGNQLHEPRHFVRGALAEIIRSTVARGGNVVIPAFAVGRMQEILYELNALVESRQLPQDLQVVVDSPLGSAATAVTARYPSVFDEAAAGLVRRHDQPFAFPGLREVRTTEESKALNGAKAPMVIIAGSGMCEAGRVVHHLKHNLWRPESTVLFVGFQAEGTLGRRILEGANLVRIHGEEVAVKARIASLPGLSAHADQAQLLAWVSHLERLPRQIFLVHGEAEGRETLERLLTERGHRVAVPALHEGVVLGAGEARTQELQKVRPLARSRTREAVARGAAMALSSERMAALLKEIQAMRKAWLIMGPSLPPGQSAELADRAEEVLHAVEQLRQLMENAGA